ncbi:MAG: hypothetical protein LBS11_03810 [Oscillospiraceae bacterium]|jgi:hypothetical protein|nr:hypothetical protein [Oscillospiraceae bacterium]
MEPIRMDSDAYGLDHMENDQEQLSETLDTAASVSVYGANAFIKGAPESPRGQGFGVDPVLASGYNPACCPGYYPGYVSSYRSQGRACMPKCPPGFRFSALWDACVPVAPAVCHASPCHAPVTTGCGCARQYPTHHKQGYGSVSNCYYPGANSACAPGYTRVGDKCVWTKW